MRTAFLLTIVVLAVAVGILVAVSESRVLLRAAVIGFLPVIWAVSSVLEWISGRDLWRFGAPYPYRSMRAHGEPALPRRHVDGSLEPPGETDGQSTVPWAA